MHWKPEHVNPMLAVRLALLNERWSAAWQEHHRLRQHLQHLAREIRQQQRFRERQANRQEAQPPPVPVSSTPTPTRQKTGRTQAQYRWGRQTFSPRMLKQAGGAKI
jgi:ribosomal protein L13E